MAIGFYFDCRGGTVRLPVNPPELTVTRVGANERAEIVKLGEINILRDAKLASIKLEFLLPESPNYSFVAGGWQRPEVYVTFFQGALDGKAPTRLVISDLGVNMMMSVESFEYTRIAGDHESIRAALSLLEYREYGAKTLVIQPVRNTVVATAASDRPVNKIQSSTYTVVKGDTLWAIAARELGSGSRYPEIAALNGVANPNLIFPGQVFQIPAR